MVLVADVDVGCGAYVVYGGGSYDDGDVEGDGGGDDNDVDDGGIKGCGGD